ncbi:S8 family serine peptidase [Alkalimarinus sediminis]|uniref:S8 family serine peptidase n=1 Tax=Alkalimarinus sediminis TaxID=1632866 RepID=A0A9E8HG75_9ALTE|nr:S8 family serine peptidase [Alkalimarinus sediminis]UZW73645.1 S8 family serine peptidase [Alkalimarinus sediminis]
MNKFNRISSVILTCLSTLIVGCGGGGDSAPLNAGIDGSVNGSNGFSVSGSIQIPVGSVADQDVMQRTVGLVSQNDSASTAQDISNPSVTGGYVSPSSGSYRDTRFSYQADPVDVYAVKLLKGQVVTLVAFPAESSVSVADLKTTLALKQRDGTLVTPPISNTSTKTIEVSNKGDYLIEVYADEGPVLYLLTVSQGVAAASQSLSMAYDFVPGEVLVKLKQSTPVSASARSSFDTFQLNERVKSQLESIEGLSSIGGSAKYGMKMKIDLSAPQARATKTLSDIQDWPEQQKAKWQTLEYIETLRARDDIEWAEPNYIRKAFAVSDNPLYAAQWHYPLIDVPAAWYASQGAGVTVAVIDTGIASAHADFAGNITQGYDFVSQVSIAGDGNGIDPNPEDMGGSYHGSHVAGTIAAVNNTVGGVGVAYKSKIMPLRALGIDGSGSDADIAQAILYAAGLENDSNRPLVKRADIINLSLGAPGISNTLKSAIDAAYNQGLILIAAAGNENSSAAFYPAAFANVVSVSAVDQTKALAPYSNFGSTITVAAPGGNMSQDANGDGNVDGVLSTVNASGYAWFQGTSMAAPHVSGVAALMVAALIEDGKPAMTGAEFLSLLASETITEDLGAVGRDNQFGYGLINASKAVEVVGGPIAPFLSVSPQSISFDGLNTSSQLTLAQGGTGSVVVTAISAVDNENSADNWLTIDPSGVVGSGLRSYTVKIDRSGKAEGESFAGTITVKYRIDGGAEETKTISVLMTVPDPNKVATVGTLYVGLIERATQEAAESATNQGQETIVIDIFAFKEAVENQGSYTYSFDDVPPGEYYVFASTNMDQDGLVSDFGEAEGDYPVVGDATLIEVKDADISGLNFNVGYQNFVEGLSTGTAPQQRVLRKIPASFQADAEGESAAQEVRKQH